MRVYIIRERKSIQLYAVAPHRRAAFLVEKRGKILAWGNSLPEAVARLGGVAEKLAVLDALSKKMR
jgi:hypothetical protein